MPNEKPRKAPARKAAVQPPDEGHRSVCPVACALDLFGDKWTLLVIRDLMSGKMFFKDFLSSPEKISTNILADRLARLVENGLAERFPTPDVAGRDAYRLTAKGQSLRSVLAALKAWGLAHIQGTEAQMQPAS
ncbi:winged helix-turn-helix transcriptional regulator [Zemynaea arenosa]|uniref:winged helix-turn-helix transcriptional regulator n=1 Tax=Zemynaea arenosa TaxID=2561931 RepID=UPI001E4DA22A|nr:helix-turn-helix domain-containing protein [Massilia arenosa]